jgi:hypothetical protein
MPCATESGGTSIGLLFLQKWVRYFRRAGSELTVGISMFGATAEPKALN